MAGERPSAAELAGRYPIVVLADGWQEPAARARHPARTGVVPYLGEPFAGYLIVAAGGWLEEPVALLLTAEQAELIRRELAELLDPP